MDAVSCVARIGRCVLDAVSLTQKQMQDRRVLDLEEFTAMEASKEMCTSGIAQVNIRVIHSSQLQVKFYMAP
jgi:hypothetical protein